jgi:hypothetical protein
MRLISLSLLTIAVVSIPNVVQAQKGKKDQEATFVKSSPTIGEMLPDISVYSPEGTPISTAELRGHYTVLTFGCLT